MPPPRGKKLLIPLAPTKATSGLAPIVPESRESPAIQ